MNRTVIKKSHKINQLFSFIINYSIKCIEKNKNVKIRKIKKVNKDNKDNQDKVINNNIEKNGNKIKFNLDENQLYYLDMLISALLDKDIK